MSTQSIVVLRKEKGFSQGDLSLLAGIHKRKISRFETGQQEPTRAELRKIKKALARKRAPNCLRLLRNLSGKTQAQAAQETGINRIKISEAERGLTKLSLDELTRLSRALNINNLKTGGNMPLNGSVEQTKKLLREAYALTGPEREAAINKAYSYALNERIKAQDFEKLLTELNITREG